MPAGRKTAPAAIPAGVEFKKYGELLGSAVCATHEGDHVESDNVVSTVARAWSKAKQHMGDRNGFFGL